MVTHKSLIHPRLNNHWLIVTFFFLFSLLWLMKTWGPAPLILTNGDAGNVSSIVASSINPARFVGDPVFADANNFNFYWTISIPLTRWISYFTHDIGQAYLLLIWPILFAQLVGFYCLGLYLFSNKGWAFLLALITVSPVYVFNGELWGQLDVPLTRGYYGALFPYILLLSIQQNYKTWFPFAVMFLCSLGIYIHPVSAPSVAFACLSSLVLSKPYERSWPKHLLLLIAAGLFFLVVATPFILNFFHGFPSSAQVSTKSNAAIAAHYMIEASGPYYYNVFLVLKAFIRTNLQWSWVWIIGMVGFFILPPYAKNPVHERQFFILFIIGLLVSSIGITWIDQTIAHMNGRAPVEIDLVRNVRYLIPLFLIGAVRFGAYATMKVTAKYRPILWGLIIGVTFCWFMAFPTTVTQLVIPKLRHEYFVNNQESRNLLNYIKKLPDGSKIIVFPQTPESEGIVAHLMLAIRYASFQPVAHLKKDLNFLSYSGNGLQILEWEKKANQLELINQVDTQLKPQLLKGFMQQHKINFLLIYEPDVSSALVSLLNAQLKLLYKQKNFSLYTQ